MNPAQLLANSRFRFPALLPAEILILQAWLSLHASEYDDIDGNIRVGQGELAHPSIDATHRQMWNDLTRPRIDALLKKGEQYTIVEVKRNANASAPVQLYTYYTLWKLDNPDKAEPALMLICDRISTDGLTVAQAHSINVQLVSVDFGVLRTSSGANSRGAAG